ncbi:LIM domain only protein 7b isoform X4 [Electrophorus electricus]|uniref:LIM domain only protein 7b isoform X4 n=1 Tax=Electrophorus electricus TaxID=8005 RepID=UPI0015D020B6|nr:LIM domain only protein 7b isoform X4 [Electrophorus electricus]
MEWRGLSAGSCETAFAEARRWLEVVTGKTFGSSNFRSALENGVLLCDLINKLKPGIIRRVNRLSTPMAGLDNVNVFLRACGKLGLNHSQLFHPGDLQDISNRVTVRCEETTRRLKNVLITIYWLGRKAQADSAYDGPQLNFKAFEGLLGVALSKVLEESSCPKAGPRDGSEARDRLAAYRREDSAESLDSPSADSDSNLLVTSEGFGSDAEAERCFRMSDGSRSETGPAPAGDWGDVPPSLRRKRAERHEADCRDPVPPLPRAPVSQSHLCGSKSVSDITSEPARQESDSRPTFEPWRGHRDAAKGAPAGPPAAEQVQSRQTPHDPTRAKDGEARWQDDLDRWKNRRRCVTSDLHRKKEEREQLHLLAGMGGADYRSTALHGGVEEESHREGVLAIRQHLQAGPRGSSAAQGPSGRGVPPSRPLVPREDPRPAFAPSEASALTSSGGMPKAASSAAPGSISATPADPASTSVSPRETGASSLASDATEGDRPADQADGSTAVFFSPPGDVDPMETSLADWQRPVPVSRAKSMEGSLPGRAYASDTLPKGFRRSEAGSRLSMGVTPRPFRAKPSKVASLPRLYSTDESHGSLAKTQRERPRLPASFGSQEKAETPDTEGCDVQTRKKMEPTDSAPTIHSFVATSAVAAAPAPEAYPQSSAWSGRGEVCYSDLRVSLNQKPGRDFGLQTDWNSTGVYIRSVQPGGPAQLCHLQAGDEIVCVGGRSAAEMSYEQWKACMDAALHEGKLLMDVRRHGQNGWNSGPSSLPFKSDKTIDLTSMDSTSGGGPERRIMDAGHPGLPLEKAGDAQVNSHPAKGLPLKAKNGSIRDGPAMTRNKGSSGCMVDSWVYLCGGSESAISDLQVPSIGTTASRWSWDAEEEKRRQEKWQMVQERLLQEKYRRDQERLEEEWRRAQAAAAGPQCGSPETQPEQRTPLSNGNATAYAPPPFFCQSTSSTFALSGQHAGEAGPAQGGQVTKQPACRTKEECDSSTKTSQWPCESYGFAKHTALDRKKSRSTPSLDSSHKQDSRAAGKKNGRVSQAEQERRQILEEMRKTTPLHTDSSWIRQQSTGSVHKEPIAAAPVMRHESLDNLPTSSSGRPMPRQFSTRCSLGSTAPYRGYSSRCSLGPGAAIFSTSFRQRSTSASPSQPVGPDAEDTPPGSQQSSSASAANVTSAGTLRPELRCACDADSSSAMPATADSECVPVSPCEQDVHHGDDTLGSAPGTAAVSTT